MSSAQAKVFATTHAAVMLLELMGEISLSNLIPEQSKGVKSRFWLQYVIGIAVSLFISSICYRAIDCLAKNGWTKTAWLMAIFPPTIFLFTGGFLLHGVDSVLTSTSGSSSIKLLRTAARKKKKCVQKTK